MTQDTDMQKFPSNLCFDNALEWLKNNPTHQISRRGWNGKGLCVKLQIPDENSKMSLPYLYMQYPATPASDTAPTTHINARAPWLASQTDILSDDWVIIMTDDCND